MHRLSFSSIGTVIAGVCLVAACGDSTGAGSGGGSTTGSTTGTGGDPTTTTTTTTTGTTTATTSAGGGGGGTGGAGVGGGSGGGAAGWTCDPTFFDSGNASDCDCGCGVQDPDCADLLVASCDYCADTGSCAESGGSCPSFINPTNNAICSAPVAETGATLCADTFDNDQDGDSDCEDSDCFGQTGCPPVGWSCSTFYFGDGTDCNCGCGGPDSDCTDALVATCDTCDNFGSCSEALTGCPGFINPTMNSICTVGVPETGATLCADTTDNDHDGEVDCEDPDCFGQTGCPAVGWTCNPNYYEDGADCDCGCGVHDPDCTDALVGTCEYCANSGSCSSASCPGTINPTNNAVCN